MDEVTAELAAATRYSLLALTACVQFAIQRAAEGDEVASRLVTLLHDAERRAWVARLEAEFARPTTEHPGP